MKRYLLTIVVCFAVTVLNLQGEEYRKWTEVETGRQIEAVMKDKKLDESAAQLLLKDGNSLWIEVSRLSDQDKEYIKKWIKPVKHLTCRIVGFKKGTKRIKVVAKAGARGVEVVAYRSPGDKKPISKKLKAGEEIEFEYEASNKYVVKAWSGKDLVDEESWNSKTGL